MPEDARERRREVHVEGDAPPAHVVLEGAARLPDEVSRVERRHVARAAAGEVEEAPDEARGAERLPLDLLDDGPPRVVGRGLVEEEAGEARDAR